MVAQVTKTDNRTIARLAKDIATMRRRVASAVRKHEALQSRIFKLQAAGRVALLSKDAPIVAGNGCWYVKAESLNTDLDVESNYYYTVIFDEWSGNYQCGCDDVRHIGNCKHITTLSANFEPAKIVEEEQEDGTIIVWSVSPNGERKEVARYRRVAANRAAYIQMYDPCMVA